MILHLTSKFKQLKLNTKLHLSYACGIVLINFPFVSLETKYEKGGGGIRVRNDLLLKMTRELQILMRVKK